MKKKIVNSITPSIKTQLSFSRTSLFSGIQTTALSASPPTRITIQVAAQLTLLVAGVRGVRPSSGLAGPSPRLKESELLLLVKTWKASERRRG